jgi:hypothetical protein
MQFPIERREFPGVRVEFPIERREFPDVRVEFPIERMEFSSAVAGTIRRLEATTDEDAQVSWRRVDAPDDGASAAHDGTGAAL